MVNERQFFRAAVGDDGLSQFAFPQTWSKQCLSPQKQHDAHNKPHARSTKPHRMLVDGFAFSQLRTKRKGRTALHHATSPHPLSHSSSSPSSLSLLAQRRLAEELATTHNHALPSSSSFDRSPVPIPRSSKSCEQFRVLNPAPPASPPPPPLSPDLPPLIGLGTNMLSSSTSTTTTVQISVRRMPSPARSNSPFSHRLGSPSPSQVSSSSPSPPIPPRSASRTSVGSFSMSNNIPAVLNRRQARTRLRPVREQQQKNKNDDLPPFYMTKVVSAPVVLNHGADDVVVIELRPSLPTVSTRTGIRKGMSVEL